MQRKTKEPRALMRGKAFHKRVQKEWYEGTSGDIQLEKHQVAGRMDMFTLENSGDAVVIEIKGTDWDRIKPPNIRKNLNSHYRQLMRYIDTYYQEGNGVCASAAMLYPQIPNTQGLRDLVEAFFHERAVVVIWFNDGEAIIS